MMAGSGEDYRRELLHRGMVLSSSRLARSWLADYLSTWRPQSKARCVDRIGWHERAFVLPDRTYGDSGGERVLLQLTGAAPHLPSRARWPAGSAEIARAGGRQLAPGARRSPRRLPAR